MGHLGEVERREHQGEHGGHQQHGPDGPEPDRASAPHHAAFGLPARACAWSSSWDSPPALSGLVSLTSGGPVLGEPVTAAEHHESPADDRPRGIVEGMRQQAQACDVARRRVEREDAADRRV